MKSFIILGLSMLLCVAQEAVTPLQKAVTEYRNGNLTAAIEILDKQIALEPDKPDYHLLRGDVYSFQGQREKAIENYSEVIKLRPETGTGYYRRAMESFRLGKLERSIVDFDKIAELYPGRAPQLWQRGICYYYAGQFEKGRQQFESHQTVNKQDVENAVWHFLCVAKIDGFEKARAQFISIAEDIRVPMMQIHSVFAGTAKPEEVFTAAQAGDPNPKELQDRLFYAHLYLGLYEEAKGDAAASLDHMKKAAGEFAQKHYMGDVARVHLKLRSR